MALTKGSDLSSDLSSASLSSDPLALSQEDIPAEWNLKEPRAERDCSHCLNRQPQLTIKESLAQSETRPSLPAVPEAEGKPSSPDTPSSTGPGHGHHSCILGTNTHSPPTESAWDPVYLWEYKIQCQAECPEVANLANL